MVRWRFVVMVRWRLVVVVVVAEVSASDGAAGPAVVATP